ncbi:MAG TPA: DNA polymerase III subunit gamma/tau [Candidatus Dojkabacteria bacterium]|nr:DNA polymerase III subunit gamma/tau [Candidatus Dojkabacteria bacterium]HQI92756.1 DNA polymerase III subunit gamma/tau [Candidatus Dojkabacteria bacterium]
MSSVLYRKYRAQDFDQLIGQGHITKLLKNAVKTNQISQAYLFVGSRGTGKTSAARILAKAVNCLHPKEDGNPCNECEVCVGITTGRLMDLIEIDAASNRGIDQIRELKEKIEYSPTDSKYKVYVIDEVHMLTTEAFNALLKTLEEPPAHVIFILATTDVHKLPPTILSRCQRYDFRLGTNEEIEKLLKDVAVKEDIKIAKEAIDILVQNAKGSYRDALSLLDVVYSGRGEGIKNISERDVRDILGLPDFDLVISLLKNLIEGSGKRSLEVIEDLEKKGVNLAQFTTYALEILRNILVEKIKGKVSKEYAFAKDTDLKTLHKLINLFLDAENKIKYSSNQGLVLEMIIPEMIKVDSEEIKIVNIDVKNKIQTTEEQKETTEESEEEEEEDNVTDESISVEDVRARWEKFVNEVKPFNGHLYAFLGGARVISFDENTLLLEVPFAFHKDRIEIPRSRDIISTTFHKVYGVNCKIVCNVNKDVKPKRKSEAEFVLRNLPPAPPKKEAARSRNMKKEVEAIFEGM